MSLKGDDLHKVFIQGSPHESSHGEDLGFLTVSRPDLNGVARRCTGQDHCSDEEVFGVFTPIKLPLPSRAPSEAALGAEEGQWGVWGPSLVLYTDSTGKGEGVGTSGGWRAPLVQTLALISSYKRGCSEGRTSH